MTKEVDLSEIKRKIENEIDFIVNSRYDNSLKKIMNRYVDGCPEHIIRKALLLNSLELNSLHKKAIKTLAESISK